MSTGNQVTLVLLTFIAIQTGDAAASEGEGASLLDIGVVIDGVPTRGVVPFRFENDSKEDIDPSHSVTVRDLSGALVPGSSETTWDRLVWRSSSPLDPLTEYEAELAFTSHSVMISFTTAADDSAPPFSPSFAPLALSEGFEADQSVCCDIVPAGNDCNFIDGYQCLALTFKPAILAVTRSLPEGLSERYMTFHADSTLRRHLEPDSEKTSYCISVAVDSLLENRTETTTLCADSADILPATFFPEDRSVSDVCQGPAVDEETGLPVGEGGCSAASSRPDTCALLAMFMILGLLRRCRRLGDRPL